MVRYKITFSALAMALSCIIFSSCSPRVAVEVPDKPITINLNVKIDHEVRVRVEKDLEQVISPNSDLF